MRDCLTQIESKLNNQELITLEQFKKTVCSKASGFYWIYTNLNMEEFIKTPPPINSAHVNFNHLAKLHHNLEYVLHQSNQDYWCIYNGKGKELKKRVGAEFTNTSCKTGKLALLRCFNEGDFRIKYVPCGGTQGPHSIVEKYENLERDFERVWRLNYGWPFLCRI